jgi:chromosome segregation protein
MKLKEIEIEGFRGVRDNLIVPFGEDFTIITGPNGAGKSSVIDAIEFALSGRLAKFGDEKTAKGESGEKGEDYVWWRGSPFARSHFIRVDFFGAPKNAGTFRIDRETSGKRPEESWFCEVAQSPPDPLQRICQTSIFRDELIGALSTDMGEIQRGEFVNRAIGLTELVAVERRCSEYLSALRQRERALQQSYDSLRGRIGDLTAEAAEIRALLRHTLLPPAQQQITLDTHTREEFTTTRARLTRARRECENLERLRARWLATKGSDSRLQILRAELSNLKDDQGRTQVRISKLESDLNNVEFQLKDIRTLNPAASSLAQIREHGKRVGLRNGRCPLCNSLIKPEQFEMHLRDLESEISIAHKQVAQITQQQASLLATLQEARAEAARIQTHSGRTNAEIASIEGARKELEEEMRSLGLQPNEDAFDLRIKNLKADLSKIEQEFASAEASVSLERVTEIERIRESVTSESNGVESRLQVVQRAVLTAEKVATTVRRTARELLEERIAALSPLLSELYFRLRPHVDYMDVKYRMRGDVQRLLRLEVGNELNPRFMFSSGQRRALGLAFLLAVHLSRPWCRLRTLILDDAVQHVDDYRALHLVEVLSSIRQSGQQIICTVEDPALAELLCRRLRSTDSGRGVKVTMKYESGKGVTVGDIERLGLLPRKVLLSA